MAQPFDHGDASHRHGDADDDPQNGSQHEKNLPTVAREEDISSGGYEKLGAYPRLASGIGLFCAARSRFD